jgi:hypothetical protein
MYEQVLPAPHAECAQIGGQAFEVSPARHATALSAA